ncbi:MULTISPECIES: peptidylprolyl isomerase [unclassified Sedimentibacter]|uniref:peptidylprolyl isomerase n=1 Tax=unclassified Sedimentibacter TaxID=2649220 RepID=UPI0027DF3D63|nr:peptidylprolyl isomerase [Sedimentibacter sp. MB35-C1]WMJ78679.1 peptidylprolyl isomerase [Sedimentibacter sp. MB35-C1]
MDNKILAKVDGREIRESDLNNLMKNLGQNAAYFQGEEGRKKLVDELVMHELMYSDAVEKDLDKDEEFIEVMENMKKSMLQQYSLRKMFNEISVSEEDIKNYYDSHKEKFVTDEMVQASHILVDSEEKANEILEDITDGLSFEDAAAQYSSCPSKQAGGSLGKFGKGQMVPEFEKAVFSMQVGEISEPVKTQFGYHIIKLTDHTTKRSSSLEEVHQEVKDACFMEKQEQLYADRKAELSNKYSVEVIK